MIVHGVGPVLWRHHVEKMSLYVPKWGVGLLITHRIIGGFFSYLINGQVGGEGGLPKKIPTQE